MHILEITVERKFADSWPVVVHQGASGPFLPMRHEGSLQLNLIELNGQATPRDYGTVLGKALFRDEVRDALAQALARSADPVRVRLDVEDAELRTLHWERLCAPVEGRWTFLSLNQRTPFSLYLPGSSGRPFPPVGRRDLRALLVAAHPENLQQYQLAPFDAAATAASLRAALGEIPADVLGTVAGAVGPPTLDALCERLTAGRYALLHLVCHGRYQPDDGETILYLARADGTVDPVTGTRLLERLSGLRGLPHFVFLSACESAAPEAAAVLGGLAQRLVRDPNLGMPAVLAMTETVSVATAQLLAERFYRRLREHGEVDLALVEACAALAERHDILVPALYSRLEDRPLFGDTPDAPLSDRATDDGLARARGLLERRAPVLLAEFDALAKTLREAPAGERGQALDAVSSLCDEALDLSFDALARGQSPPAYDERCPFLGLDPFRVEDGEFFFGREALVAHLQERLAEDNFLAVVGPSGCGKSSLVLAGLVPALRSKDPNFQPAYLTPGSDPLDSLDVALRGSSRVSLLIVDQLEALFTNGAEAARRQAFLDRVLHLSETMKVVIVLRADFWGECALSPDLAERMRDRREWIAPMTTRELRRAMEEQARRVGLRFGAEVCGTILDDVEGEPGGMSLLQLALKELWKRRHGRWLHAEEYRKTGGVAEVLAETATGVYRDFSAEDQERARGLFLRLIRPDDNPVPGEEPRDTPQRVKLEELVPEAGAPEETKRLVKRLADARLVTTGGKPEAGQEEVELSHGALIRRWGPLRGWLAVDRDALRLRAGLRAAMYEWQGQGKKAEFLVHHGRRLQAAEALRLHPRCGLNRREQEYLDACAWARSRRLYIRVRLLEASAVALLALGWVTSLFWWRAEKNRYIQHIATAQREWSENHVGEVLKSLEACRPGLRRWEWHYLNRLCHTDLLTLRGHEGPAYAVAFSPDEKYLASAGQDAIVRIWDAASGTLVRSLRDHVGVVSGLAYSPDGRLLASASADQTVKVWDTETGKVRYTFAGHVGAGEVLAVAFSCDGQFVASASLDRTVIVWGPTTGAVRFTWDGLSGTCVAFHPGVLQLAAADAENTVKVWEATTGNKLFSFPGHQSAVRSVAFSRVGGFLASAGGDQTVRVWDLLEPGSPFHTRLEHADEVTSVTFRARGPELASAGADQTVRIWNVRTGKELRCLRGHTAPVRSVAFDSSGKRLATASDDGTVKLWDADVQQESRVFGKHGKGLISGVAFSADGKRAASASWDGTVKVWDVAAGKELRAITHVKHLMQHAMSPDGMRLASASADRTVRVWDADTGQERFTLSFAEEVYAVVFSPDGELLVSAGVDRTIRVCDANNGADCFSLQGHDDSVTTVAFSPDGRRLASGSNDKTVKVWDMSSGRLLCTGAGHEDTVASVAFSPNGRRLASAGYDKTVKIWDGNGGTKPLLSLTGHQQHVPGVAFSPDGERLASAGADRTVKIWDVETGQELLTLPHPSGVSCVAFSPDGRLLLSGTGQNLVGEIRIWDATPLGPSHSP